MTYIKPIVVALALISMTACSGSKKNNPNSTIKVNRTAWSNWKYHLI